MSAPCPTFGFIVRAASDRDAGALRRALTQRLADSGLVFEQRDEAIVVTREGTQATESDRRLVTALLAADLDVAAANVSELVDLTY